MLFEEGFPIVEVYIDMLIDPFSLLDVVIFEFFQVGLNNASCSDWLIFLGFLGFVLLQLG